MEKTLFETYGNHITCFKTSDWEKIKEVISKYPEAYAELKALGIVAGSIDLEIEEEGE